MMVAKKIDAMHALYGTAEGQCKDCPHLESEKDLGAQQGRARDAKSV